MNSTSDPFADAQPKFRLRDPFAGLSHLVGAILAIAGMVVLICMSPGKPWHIVSFSIYGATMITLYLASAVYHLIPQSVERMEQWLAVDQAAIYLLIAGTYTPICLVPLRGPWGWSLFGVIWGLAFTGIALRFAWKSAPKWLSLVLYLAMGWLCVIGGQALVKSLSPTAMAYLVLGGVLYTVGSVVFVTDRPRLWPGKFGAHDLWHVFVLGASGCHFALMCLLALGR